MMDNTIPNRHSEETIPARPDVDLTHSDAQRAPYLLQRHFDGDIDLDRELNSRFHAMPVLSSVKFQRLDSDHAWAMLTTQDGAATARVEVDLVENEIAFVYTLRSMLGLKFSIRALGDNHRARWLDLMRHTRGRPAFLWGPARWNSDYLIAVAYQYYTNVYAFSSNHFEAAARLTPDTREQLLDWLNEMWQPGRRLEDTMPALTTW